MTNSSDAPAPTLHDTLLQLVDQQYTKSKRKIEVPEWATKDNPNGIYYAYESTPADYSNAMRLAAGWQMEGDNYAITTAVVIIKLLDKDGKRVFQDTALPQLLEKGNSDLLSRISADMRKDVDYAEGIEGAKKP